MNGKLPVLALVIASLVIGYVLGRVVLSVARGYPWLTRSVGLAGAVICFVGLVSDAADRRFLLLAGGGLGLQLAWFLDSRSKKAVIRSHRPDEENPA